jgi:hypothetical protein
VLEFDTEAERDAFIQKINSDNTLDYAPDIYWRAEKGKDRITPAGNLPYDPSDSSLNDGRISDL